MLPLSVHLYTEWRHSVVFLAHYHVVLCIYNLYKIMHTIGLCNFRKTYHKLKYIVHDISIHNALDGVIHTPRSLIYHDVRPVKWFNSWPYHIINYCGFLRRKILFINLYLCRPEKNYDSCLIVEVFNSSNFRQGKEWCHKRPLPFPFPWYKYWPLAL